MSTSITPSAKAQKKMNELSLQLRAFQIAQMFWEQELSQADRDRLLPEETIAKIAGRDKTAEHELVSVAIDHFGSVVAMWQQLHGVSLNRAVVELGLRMNLLTATQHTWLLRECGEAIEEHQSLRRLSANGQLVLRDTPREVYWCGEKVRIDWNTHEADWIYLWKLCRCSKDNVPLQVSHFDHLPAAPQGDYLIKTRSRLTNREAFPTSLDELIQTEDRSQKLDLPREKIHIFEIDQRSVIREWFPPRSVASKK